MVSNSPQTFPATSPNFPYPIPPSSVPSGTIVSYFNGVRVKEADVFAGGPDKDKSVYLVEIGEEDDYLDVPGPFSKWENYQVGHNSVFP